MRAVCWWLFVCRGYDWEEYAQPVDDNSVGQRASALVSLLKGRSSAYRHRHLLVPFGDDFKFRNAELQFSNMGRLVRHIQEHSQEMGVWAQFSTLSDYFAAAHSEGQFPSLQGDFMPYADNEQSYWTVPQRRTQRRMHALACPTRAHPPAFSSSSCRAGEQGYYTTRPLLKDRSRMSDAATRAHAGSLCPLSCSVEAPHYRLNSCACCAVLCRCGMQSGRAVARC